MSLNRYVRQLKPIQNNKVNYVQQVQEVVEKLPQEKQLSVDSLVASDKKYRTPMYEAAGTIVALVGKKPITKTDMEQAMKHKEFSSKAKEWIDDFLKTHSNKEALEALLNWFATTGSGVAEITGGAFVDFIHENIGKYYKAAPESFQVPTGEKPNTADMVCIKSGNGDKLISALKDISKLNNKEQQSRLDTQSDGLVILKDSKGKEIVSFYQVSLKKGFEAARVGRVTTFINKNFIGGVSSGDPLQARDAELKLRQEGFFSDIIDKFKNIVSSGFKNFVSWVEKSYTKLSQVIARVAVKLSNQIIKKNRGMKAINNVLNNVNLNESNLTTFLGEQKTNKVRITKTLKSQFQLIKKEFINNKEGLINKLHKDNIKLIEKLNSKKSAERTIDPIQMLPNNNAGILEMNEIKNGIDKILKTKENDEVTKSDLYLTLKVGMNYCANVAIFAILKNIEKNLSKYDTLSQALFAFSAEFESEAKFGNTSLPIVIAYGGEKGSVTVMGTRDDYKTDLTGELSNTGKNANDFPIFVISVKKSGAKGDKSGQLYNVVHLKTVTSFEEVNNKPEPKYLVFELTTDQSRQFTLKIEANRYESKTKALTIK